MPITQERMLDLIGAAEALEEAYRGLCQRLDLLIHRHEKGEVKDHELPVEILIIKNQAQPDYQHGVTIGSERKHFLLMAQKNKANRDRQRARRPDGKSPEGPKPSRIVGLLAHERLIAEAERQIEEDIRLMEGDPSLPPPPKGQPKAFPARTQTQSRHKDGTIGETEGEVVQPPKPEDSLF